MTVEELDTNIKKKQAEIRELVAARNAAKYENLKPKVGKYYQNKFTKDKYMFIDFISKDTFRPFGYIVTYKEMHIACMDDPADWVEIPKQEFEIAFNSEVDRLRKEMKL
ncbi:hypothetical protein [Dysgonomonas macrotermitis]|uniref:Uncharacterized protein n=1 Tax=Dysgonomonas macrotermitis TaxID=1346286 RepID=A0A1M4UNA5_9BACT|nr:hypothetical protein [Dysgonomonas macrotermitis]SHE58196.1 hypothetical protein SAMN05444362_101653 [Dysgonomonas macrotermitis]